MIIPNHVFSENRHPSPTGQGRVKTILFPEKWYHLRYGHNYLAKDGAHSSNIYVVSVMTEGVS